MDGLDIREDLHIDVSLIWSQIPLQDYEMSIMRRLMRTVLYRQTRYISYSCVSILA